MILVTFIKKPNNRRSTPAPTSTSHPSCDYSRAPSRPSHCTAPAASLKCYLLKTYTHDQHSFRDNWSPPSPNLKGLNGHYTRGNGGAGGAGGPAWHCVLLLCAVVCALFDTAAVCAFCLVMMKGNLFIWFQNPDHMKSLHHYFSNPAYANPYRRAVNVYRVSKHTHCPFHWLFLHKHTKKNPWNITSPCDLTTDLVFLKHGIGSLPQLVKHLPLTLSLFAGFATKQQPANVLEVPTRTAFYLTAANAPSLLSQNGSRKSFQESGRVSSQRHSQAGFQSHYF